MVHCKFSKNGKRGNVVELAAPGDWVVGTGGQDLTKSSGNGTIVYAMKVTEATPLADYLKDPRFAAREVGNSRPANIAKRKALVSGEFYYFGRRARSIPARFRNFPNPKLGAVPKQFSLEKKFSGFKSHFPEPFIAAFENWISQFRHGKNGIPCGLQPPGTCRTCACTGHGGRA